MLAGLNLALNIATLYVATRVSAIVKETRKEWVQLLLDREQEQRTN